MSVTADGKKKKGFRAGSFFGETLLRNDDVGHVWRCICECICVHGMYVCEGGMVLSYKISMRLNVATVVEKKRREVV